MYNKKAWILGILGTFLITLGCMQSFSFALELGTNITIYDGTSNKKPHDWHGSREDQEVEPGDVASQVWDLEGFFLNGYTLSVVGGFNFKDGYDGVDSGDIFIDIDNNARYGGNQTNPTNRINGNIDISNEYGYDYVLDLDFDNLTYNVFKLSQNSSLKSVYYGHNDWSNPWKYNLDSLISPISINNPITYYKDLSDTDTGLSGGNHYAFSLDLSFLPHHAEFISHFTIGCGNDNLMGRGVLPAPEPATILLFGTGLIGISVVFRKKKSA